MDCDVAREALSARIDGEREPVPSARVEEHLQNCPRCRAWYEHARRFTVELRHLAGADDPIAASPAAPAPPVPGRPRAVRATVSTPPPASAAARDRPGGWLNWALAGIGILQLGLVAAQAAGTDFGMVGGVQHGAASGLHLLHESTAWSAAVCAVTLAAAFRARLIPGLACVLAVYVVVLGYFVVADQLSGQVTAGRIASHLPVLAAALLAGLVWRREHRVPTPGAPAAARANDKHGDRRAQPWPRGDSAA
ncbi:zf-HC2 domain-containing protein [Mycolicibacterium palauense]|uniref:zf-HC2 domain-containing protein n=1 Tax=Mycolicibacterium palauense TaxID=2034511 RepID=UPI00159BCEC9|nr:zf-HC2 domain-containing protein [Mycolicibacterium palauense]